MKTNRTTGLLTIRSFRVVSQSPIGGFIRITAILFAFILSAGINKTFAQTPTDTERYSVGGRIATADGKGLSGASVAITLLSSTATASPIILTTNDEGMYEAKLPKGRYGIMPKMEGYNFFPEKREVSVTNVDVRGQDFRAQARDTSEKGARFSLSGRVVYRKDDAEQGLAGVSVGIMLLGTSATTMPIVLTTNTDGYYRAEVPNGRYGIMPKLEGYAFSPEKREVFVNNADVTGQDFRALRDTTGGGRDSNATRRFLLSGRVSTGDGKGLAGVTVGVMALGTTATLPPLLLTTNDEGVYRAEVPNGRYGIMPKFEGYIFSPEKREVSVNNADVTGQDFRARRDTTGGGDTNAVRRFSLSGRVSTGDGKGLAGVTVGIAALGSTASVSPLSVTTNADGYYRAEVPNGRYGIVPKLEKYAFSPTKREVSVNNADVTGQDFRALRDTTVSGGQDSNTTKRFVLAGRVTNGDGKGVGGVAIAISLLSSTATTSPITLKTGAEGYYETQVPSGRYGIVPKLEGYTFTPSRREATVNNAGVTGQDFRALRDTTGSGGRDTNTTKRYIVGGRVTSSTGGTVRGLAGVTITMSNGASAVTNGDGNYQINGVAPGVYTLVATLSGYSFSPEKREVKVESSNVSGQDFSAARKTASSPEPNPTPAPTTVGQISLSCYPNPANAQSTIRFTLSEAATVSLGVYSKTGSLVATLESGKSETAGTHEVSFVIPATLRSDNYLVVLKTATSASSITLRVER